MPLKPRKKAPALATSEALAATTSVPVLGLLQNQWFKDPSRIPRVIAQYERHLPPAQARARFIRDMLFFGCLTGRRIRQAFGEGLLDLMTFEEVSPEIGGSPASVFPPDIRHVTGVLMTFRPRIVVLFGKVAAEALNDQSLAAVVRTQLAARLIYTVHPTARGADVPARLREAANEVREALKEKA